MWFFFFKQKTAYEMRISDWSSDVCSSDLVPRAHFFLVGLGFGFDGLRNHGLGELHALQQDVLADVAQGFACSDVFQADHSGDVACQNFLDFSTVVGVHLQDTRSEEHTSELQSLMRISYAVFCLTKKKKHRHHNHTTIYEYNHH